MVEVNKGPHLLEKTSENNGEMNRFMEENNELHHSADSLEVEVEIVKRAEEDLARITV